jgi:uncharacterized protein
MAEAASVRRRATIPDLEPVSRIPPEVADRLGYYVYLYVDPRSGLPFYVGKGQDQRVLAHLSVVGESRKAKVLAELNQLGMSPRLDILAHALPSEETALRIEAAVIDLLGRLVALLAVGGVLLLSWRL